MNYKIQIYMSKTIILASLCILLIASVNSATFSINSISTCTNTSTTGFCTRWEQNGSVVQTTSCFPEEAQVYVLRNGFPELLTMNNLVVGDKIQGYNGHQEIYTEVIGWLHKNVSAFGSYLKIQTQTSQLIVSSLHNIALQDGSYSFANQLMNKHLHGGQTVLKISEISAKGIYAPLTNQGNYYVQIGDNKKFLAHSYANIRNPEFYKPFFSAIWWGWQKIFGVNSSQQIHPAAEWAMKVFNSLIQH